MCIFKNFMVVIFIVLLPFTFYAQPVNTLTNSISAGDRTSNKFPGGADGALVSICDTPPDVPNDLTFKSQFGETPELNVKTRNIWAIWWYPQFDHDADAEWLLDQLDDVRCRAINELGMQDPPNPGRGYFYNVYIHHGEDDGFPTWWANGQGTDQYGNPYLTLPNGAHLDAGNIRHEGFHIFQYSANSPGFSYSGDSQWYVESSAQWFSVSQDASETGAFVEAGAIDGNPHLALWHSFSNEAPGDPTDWMFQVRQYGMHTYLYYLTEFAGMDRDIITSGFYTATNKSPQQYHFDNAGGDNLRKYFADWAAHNTADFDYLLPAQVERARLEVQWVGDPDNIHPYVAEYYDEGTEGNWKRPPASLTPRGWSYNVVRINNSSPAEYTFSLRGDETGSENAVSHFEGRIVVINSSGAGYTAMNMTNALEGTASVSVEESDSEVYLVVAAVPEYFSGNQTYSYQYLIGRNPDELQDTTDVLNLVLPVNGGLLESFTSEYGSGWVASDLTNGIKNEDGWCSAVNPGLQEFVFSFLDGLSATLNEAIIHGGTGEGSYFSKDVEVWTSADGNIFTKAADGTLQNVNSSTVTLNLGDTPAKKVKLVVASGYRTDYWELAEFELYGYFSSPPPDGTYYLKVNSGGGDGYYEPGQSVSITADTPPADHEFEKWEVISGSPQIADVTASTTNLTMGQGAVTVSAVYKNNSSDNKVKVFIMAGQSNMVGQGTVSPTQAHLDKNGGMGTLEYLVNDASKAPMYDHLVTAGGQWTERNDVWIVNLDNSGPLSVGYGKDGDHFGPEMQFGHVIGDYYDNQVLIIKTSWGGKSLYVDFRPPGSGGEVGPYYTMMIERVHEVLNNISQFMPAYQEQGYEIAGFGWHQGWNDRIDDAANAEYQTNCVNLINDLRDEFQVTDMPFVLATTGMAGWDETHPRALSLMEAQLAVPDDNRLKYRGNVAAVETRDFWRDVDVSPADQNYHWNRNAESYFLIGNGMGEAMVQLLIWGETTHSDDLANDPEEFKLMQNFPNPFNPSTTIKYSIADAETGHSTSLHMVTLKVYDLLGREVAVLVDEYQRPGTYRVEWNAEDFPSGIYIYKITTNKFANVKKMVLVK